MHKLQQAAELHALLLKGKMLKFKKGQVLQRSDTKEGMVLIKKGYIKRYLIANDGSIGIHGIYGPGYIFSLTQALRILFDQSVYDGPETFYYEAMGDAEVYVLDAETFAKGVEDNPRLYRGLLAVSGRRLRSNIEKFENLTMASAYQRVAHQLLCLANDYGLRRVGGTKIDVPLTHADIAGLLSITRETASRCITQLRKKKLIKTRGGIIIPNMEKLKAEVYEL